MLDLPDTKPLLERIFRPFARRLSHHGIRPNTLTLASVGISVLAGGVALAFPTARWPLWAILAAMLARLALNHLDGILAREHGMKTRWGGLLNEIATPGEDLALYLPLAARPEMPAVLIVCAVALGVLVEVAGLSSVTIGGTRRCDGPMSKVVRGAFFGALMLGAALDVPPARWTPAVLAAGLGLLAVTAWNRLSRAVGEARS